HLIPGIAASENAIPGVAADQAIGFGDGATRPCTAVAPSHRPTLAVPGWTLDHVVAVAQRGDGAADIILGVAADKAVGGGDGTGGPCTAVAPSHLPAIAVPVRTLDHVVAVAQEGDAATGVNIAHKIPGIAAHEAIGGGNRAAGPRTAVAP